MSDNRRTFLGHLGLGIAGAVAAFVPARRAQTHEVPTEHSDKPLGSVRIKTQKPRTYVDQPGFIQPLDICYKRKSNAPVDIIRIAHDVSAVVREGLVKPGHWYQHSYGETNFKDIGKSIQCVGYALIGARAMRFSTPTLGTEPSEVSDDPDSDLYKRIMADAKPPEYTGCVYGPVYRFLLPGLREVELFCLNKSTRRFALYLKTEPYHGSCTLRTKKVTSRRMGFSWYVPELEITYNAT